LWGRVRVGATHTIAPVDIDQILEATRDVITPVAVIDDDSSSGT
jgi:hypothetical protein